MLIGLGRTTAAAFEGIIVAIVFRKHTRGASRTPFGFGPLLSIRYYIPV